MNMGQPLLCRLGQQEIYHSKYITNSHLILYQLENQAQPGNHTFSIKVNPSNIGHTNQTKKQRDKQRFIVVLTCLVNNFFAGVYFYPFANISSNMRLGGGRSGKDFKCTVVNRIYVTLYTWRVTKNFSLRDCKGKMKGSIG